MNPFFRLIRAESLKYRSKITLLWALLPLVLVVLLASQMETLHAADPQRRQWPFFFQLFAAHWGVFLFTPFLVFWSSYTWVVEQKNWKLITCQGVSRTSLFLAKVATTLGLALLQALFLGFLFLSTGRFLGLEGQPPWDQLGLLVLTPLAALPIIAIQMLLATFSSRLLGLLMAGLFGHFVSLLAIRLPVGRFLPWSYCLEVLKLRGAEAFTHPLYVATSVLLGFAIVTAGAWRFRRLAF